MALRDTLNFLPKRQRPPPVVGDAGLSGRVLACLPAVLRRAITARDRRLIVAPDGATATLTLTVGEASESLGTLALTGGEPLPPQVASGPKGQPHRTLLRLPTDAVLTRRASFPAQVRNTLPQAIHYELDRLSPFTPEQVAMDFALHPAAKTDARLTVDLALCRRDRLDPWVKRLREAGSPAHQATWDGAWPGANLLVAEERPRLSGPWLNPSVLLVALALLLGAAALATPLWQKTQILANLEREVRQARGQAIAVDELRKELEQARQGSTAVLQQKWEQPRIVDLLRELTERIPEDTWVQSLEYQNGEVQVRGESGQATALIGLLEQAPGIEGVSFRSPVTQVARTGKERFNLAFTVRREPDQ